MKLSINNNVQGAQSKSRTSTYFSSQGPWV